MVAQQVEALLAVAREGSFSTAARGLGVAQSTVSRRVRALEVAVGRPLLARTPGGPPTTPPAGAAFLGNAPAILQAFAVAEAACRR
jgi:molybdate transport repressor ModE-like protein